MRELLSTNKKLTLLFLYCLYMVQLLSVFLGVCVNAGEGGADHAIGRSIGGDRGQGEEQTILSRIGDRDANGQWVVT